MTVGFFVVRIMRVRIPLPRAGCKAACASLLLFSLCQPEARADWQRDETTIGWRAGTNVLWRFSFDPKKGKPFFHPLTAGGGPSLTNFKPEDHPWHYGLWFSWKYINHVNYWEEDRATGRAEGATRWSAPVIEAQKDGGAVIRLELTYVNPSNRVDMTERRELRISAPAADGSYAIDWRAHFVAGAEGAALDRTAMPGETNGQVNGGYAGLGLRMAGPPLTISMLCGAGPITRFENDRARPAAPAVACNFAEGGKDAGGVAIFSDPANAGVNAPWYLVNSQTMRFACAAILASKPLTLPPGGQLELHYRIAVQLRAWTLEALRAGR